ncbi:helix-turn-helix domain-containing protein [Nonomuraea sp. NEAU-A123]|nr:helix-turn-helix domain-containing protein [Nonomuraea sp. NEAU-A123]
MQRAAKTTEGTRVTTHREQSRGRPGKELDPGASLLSALGAKLRELRKARRLTLMRLSEMTGYSWQHLGAVERGDVTPSESVINSCDSALGTGGLLCGMLPGVIREQAHVRHSNEAARRAGCAGSELLADWGRLLACSNKVSTITSAVVDDVEAITAHQRHLYHELTSAQMLASVDGHLGVLLSLLGTPCTESLRRRVASAAGEAAGFSAWIWYDLGDHYKMTHRYATAAHALAEAHNLGLRAYVVAYQALTADAAGRTDDAIRHAATALDMACRTVSAVTMSWFHSVHATTLARAGKGKEARVELGHAHDAMDLAGEARDEWMYLFDRQRLLGYQGACLLTLGDPLGAVQAFEEALDGVPPACVRRRAEISVDLAEALARRGETEEAVRIAREAASVLIQRGSVSGVGRVKQFRDRMAADGHATAVRDLDEFVRSWKG